MPMRQLLILLHLFVFAGNASSFVLYREGRQHQCESINDDYDASFLQLPTLHVHHHHQDTEDQQRLLLTETAVSAYLQAEIQSWLLAPFDKDEEEDPNSEIESWMLEPFLDNDHKTAITSVSEAATKVAESVADAYRLASQANILSNHGALISFMSTELNGQHPQKSHDGNSGAAFVILKTNAYNVAKRAVDLLHHRLYRGTYTKTIAPIGVGEIAARKAVRLPPVLETQSADKEGQELDVDEDNCLVEAPPELTETDCLWTEDDDVAWRQKRFERITMEGWRDPRRGNSGTSR